MALSSRGKERKNAADCRGTLQTHIRPARIFYRPSGHCLGNATDTSVGNRGNKVSVHVDAAAHDVAALIAMARDAARERFYMVITGGHTMSTHDIIAVTSAGAGFVSFLMEPPDRK